MLHRRTFLTLAFAFLLIGPARSENAPTFTRTEDVVYGRKFGVALTLDVIQPVKANGYGIVFMVSGGWFSSHDNINPGYVTRPTSTAATRCFAVVHGSQPKFTIPEIEPDIHRAIRFIRHNAQKWNVNPDHLGITGGSAGGHLSLTMGTQGGPGHKDAKDPVDRESSAVQAVACFFPPTDFLNYGTPGEDAVGVGTLKDYKPAFGPGSDTAGKPAETRQGNFADLFHHPKDAAHAHRPWRRGQTGPDPAVAKVSSSTPPSPEPPQNLLSKPAAGTAGAAWKTRWPRWQIGSMNICAG